MYNYLGMHRSTSTSSSASSSHLTLGAIAGIAVGLDSCWHWRSSSVSRRRKASEQSPQARHQYAYDEKENVKEMATRQRSARHGRIKRVIKNTISASGFRTFLPTNLGTQSGGHSGACRRPRQRRQ